MHLQICSLPSCFFNVAFSHSNFSFELTLVKSAIRQGRRSMPVNGYEARVVMALLQCAETLQGDLKVAIKEDKDWYSRFMPLTEVVKEERRSIGMVITPSSRNCLGRQRPKGRRRSSRQEKEKMEQHWWYSSDLSLVTTTSSSNLGRESFIDLNLLALAEEDDANQFEDSAVSDADFVNPVKVFPS
ncbi:hypothetical protein Ahy_B09g097867 isoform B [Arachis hypogaea]|uniref:Uncharacterized protein n=1 Tax=Arachis hypogaea TaxID=3818 RepID=A0A444XQ29_ARAHY|nr:hypothetical protein Ahy_B09g097867 isoform B [Arachis hypogaea]